MPPPDQRPSANAVAVCGPNASGKTHLGIAIARALGGEILSVDSRQVYRGMDIGTGKDLAEYSRGGPAVPYHLVDIVDPSELYTLWRFQADFYDAFRAVSRRRAVPVAVGGTGLYLEAVLRHYEVPNVPEDPGFRHSLMSEDRETLAERLKREAPDIAARTDSSTKKRIVRALEIARAARSQQVQWGHADPPAIRPIVLGVQWPRPALHERIRARLESRLRDGMVEEVARLRSQGIGDQRLDLFGMEYRHIARHLRGETSLSDMREQLFTDICRLAKRQETFFRGMARRGTEVHWIPEGSVDVALRLLSDLLPSV
jgi:tRNA dimethylallyltransferase